MNRSLLLAFIVLASGAVAQAGGARPAKSKPSQPPAADQVRAWMADLPADAAQADASAPSFSTAVHDPNLDPWDLYLRADAIELPARREEALGKLLARGVPDALRGVILLELKTGPAYQSRQAEFVRRYGFYANWFNRMAYVATRAAQGNIQAVSQLFVDGVFDFASRGTASPAERRLYRALDESEREGRARSTDRRRMAELEAKIARAQAEVDLERAEWAMEQGGPELAAVYAKSALARRPGWGRAEGTLELAEAAASRRVREGVRSAQMGYPDRKPPLKISPVGAMRAAAAGDSVALAAFADGARREGIFPRSSDALFAAMLAQKVEPGNPAAGLRAWSDSLSLMEDPSRRHAAWVGEALRDPRFNPELRLARAQAGRRESLVGYVFFGPQTARERSYVLSSRVAQAWNALSGVGFFYVFEVVYRAGLAAIKPPPPAEETLDAQGAFIRWAPLNAESRRIARRLADQKIAKSDYDAARALLRDQGLLDPATEREIAAGEAAWIAERAAGLSVGDPSRAAALKRATELAPGSPGAQRAKREMAKKPPAGETIKVEAAWSALRQWTGQPAPAGLPGNADWFDGRKDNGEICDPTFHIESEGVEPTKVSVSYATRKEKIEDIHTWRITLANLPPATAEWIRHALAERRRVDRGLEKLDRTPFPFEVTGGLGFSGVDFYPRLLPLDSNAGEAKLYSD